MAEYDWKRKMLIIERNDDAFALIAERHGAEIFQSYTLIGLLGDYTPNLTQERRLVKIAVEAEAYKAIYEAPDHEKVAVLEKYIVLLSENYFIDKMWARKDLLWCLGAVLLAKDNSLFLEDLNQTMDQNAVVLVNKNPDDDIPTKKKETVSKELKGKVTPDMKQSSQHAHQKRIDTERDNKSARNIMMNPVGKTSCFLKMKLMLAKGFSDIREISKSDCENPIELPDAKFNRYYFDFQAKAVLYDTEYFIVTQPMAGQKGDTVFVY